MVKKPTDKNTKAQILEAFEELAKEKAALETQLRQQRKENSAAVTSAAVPEKKSSESVTVMNQTQSNKSKMEQTIESLAKIQLGFGGAVSELSEKLTLEASQLEEIRQAVADEIQQIEELHNLEIEDDTLNTLIQQYEESSKTFEEELTQRRETLEQELQNLKTSWLKEQEEHKRLIKERNETQNKAKIRDADTYKYDLELQRRLDVDGYEQNKKTLYKQLEDLKQEQEKQWAEREKVIAEREKQFEETKAKVEAFPKEKEAAIKKATEEGKGIAHYQAKIKADLYSKEVEGQKRYYELRIQSLEETIRNQEARIQNISKQLDSALKQVQDLAVKAIEGTSNANSFQSLKEITLEQAKSLQKTK